MILECVPSVVFHGDKNKDGPIIFLTQCATNKVFNCMMPILIVRPALL